ncbi:MAG TPA: Bcr/CflA family multidrug efflux MFS transporter [Jiangellaceae bacterium]|nr:Bcr/CflA family multidrug efflux MFS transporter [Jiangellaceae bacterium]
MATEKSTLVRFVLMLGAFTALGPLTVDLYLPAFPAISGDLEVAESAVQLTLTGTLIGFASGQLLVGPLSDTIGRRRPLLMATSLHVAASIACAVAPTIEVLGVLRVFQGMAAAAGTVVSLAIVRDSFNGLAAGRLLSRLMLVVGVAPILAPSLGGQILRFTDWRGVFWVLAGFSSLLVVIVVFALRETLPAQRRRTGGVRDAGRAYRMVLTDRAFVGLMLTSGLTMAAMFSYISASSFVLQGIYGLSEQAYGLMFGVNAMGMVIATQVNGRLIRRVNPQWLMATALVTAIAVASVMVLGASTGAFGLWGIAVPLFVMLTCVGFIMPNTPVLALYRHERSAGTAAALIGAANFGIGAGVAPVLGAFGSGSAVPMAVTMLVAASLAATAFFTLARPRQLPDLIAEEADRAEAPRVPDGSTH